MNREQTIEAIKVMQAWVDGKAVQQIPRLETRAKNVEYEWSGGFDFDWDWDRMQYRIKPDPHVFYLVRKEDGEFGTFRWGDQKEAGEFIVNNPGLGWKCVVKFVEVVEDQAKPAYDAGLPPVTIIPASVRPLVRPFMRGDKGKTVGGWAYTVGAETGNGHLYVEHKDNGLPSQPRRQYEMIHAKDGSAGAAGPDHQLLPPEVF